MAGRYRRRRGNGACHSYMERGVRLPEPFASHPLLHGLHRPGRGDRLCFHGAAPTVARLPHRAAAGGIACARTAQHESHPCRKTTPAEPRQLQTAVEDFPAHGLVRVRLRYFGDPRVYRLLRAALIAWRACSGARDLP